MGAIVERSLPVWVCCMRTNVADAMTAEARRTYRVQVAAETGVADEALDDEPAMPDARAVLLDELKAVQARLKPHPGSSTSSGSEYLEGATTPTAADFSLYVMLERLVDGMGDIAVVCLLLELAHDKELARLWAWHKMMHAQSPTTPFGSRARDRQASSSRPRTKPKQLRHCVDG